jgi:hypothetical protein
MIVCISVIIINTIDKNRWKTQPEQLAGVFNNQNEKQNISYFSLTVLTRMK